MVVDWEQRVEEGVEAAARAYEGGDGLPALALLVGYSVSLEEENTELREGMKQLEVVLNHILNEATSWGDYEPEDGELKRIADLVRAVLFPEDEGG